MREIKIQVLWVRERIDFTKAICEHFTTVERLCNGEDKFPYKDVNIIAKRQFTGLQDCNGEEIYEGDILDRSMSPGDDSCPFEVVFEDGGFRSSYPSWDESLNKPLLTEFGLKQLDYRIIGNIHLHSELLKP